jgi:hypothetical protein
VPSLLRGEPTARVSGLIAGVPAPECDAEDEVASASLPRGAPGSFRTAFSLAEPGTVASFKVDVILGQKAFHVKVRDYGPAFSTCFA